MIGTGKRVVEVLGWYGLVAVLVAYGLVSFGTILPNNVAFQLLNLTGSFGLGILTFYKKAYPNLVLNVIWGAISLIAIVRILLTLT